MCLVPCAVKEKKLNLRIELVEALGAGLPHFLKHMRSPQEFSVKVDSKETQSLALAVGRSELAEVGVVGDSPSFMSLRDKVRDTLSKDRELSCVSVALNPSVINHLPCQ